MPNRDSQLPNYPVVEVVMGAIAEWVNRYRYAIGIDRQFGECGPDDVQRIASDLGVSPSQLRELANKGPGAADMLQKMLVALHVDPKALAEADPITMRDLQRLCITCGDKTRCKHELSNGTAAENFREFCPNALTLDAILGQTGRAPRH